MKKIIILLVFIVSAGLFLMDASKEVKACFGCECTNSCDDNTP